MELVSISTLVNGETCFPNLQSDSLDQLDSAAILRWNQLRYLSKILWMSTNVLTISDLKMLFKEHHFIKVCLSSIHNSKGDDLFVACLIQQEMALMTSYIAPCHMLCHLMDWHPKDLSGGNAPIENMYETQLNFTCVYCLVDVLSFYETPSAPQ
jgi:hypothetical protein